jgi:hypothetical protein
LYVTTIEQLVPLGTATTSVASDPALTGDVSEERVTFPVWLTLPAGACPVVWVGVVVGGPVVAAPLRQRKARIGWSSIAFGATPVWPWKKSKKATPSMIARGQSLTAARAASVAVVVGSLYWCKREMEPR